MHFRRLWATLFTRADHAGADAVLVACLDLSGVVRHAATGTTVVDAAQCLARAIVDTWLAGRARPAQADSPA